MRKTRVDQETGQVRCSKCGATDFTDKRSLKGKMALGVMAPKRLQCRGCGTYLKKG